MKEFEPSRDFVANVMKQVLAYESARTEGYGLAATIFSTRPFRYAMSGGGIFLGVVLTPVVCH